ncbi:hypothetical protein LWI28_020689 [Acer negundo]|uniref:Uncharacterized protein n=1 Tax=Acer negundo TaxID=4023 RepID=A0AAD5JB57_ACENE|nr:hypothetical protein LWI28_020689 [Acer negundo]
MWMHPDYIYEVSSQVQQFPLKLFNRSRGGLVVELSVEGLKCGSMWTLDLPALHQMGIRHVAPGPSRVEDSLSSSEFSSRSSFERGSIESLFEGRGASNVVDTEVMQLGRMGYEAMYNSEEYYSFVGSRFSRGTLKGRAGAHDKGMVCFTVDEAY